MASLDVIALDPTVPQLRAPGVGDTYHFCRVVEFQDGTDAAPSITNVGDTNTGIYWPNADELAVSTGGVQRMSLGATTVFNETGADVDFRIEGDTDANLVFVDASTDRVGLGLNNPDRLLDVDGSSKFRGQILITSGEALTLGLQALQLPTGVESTIGAGLSTRTGVAGESIVQFGNNMNTYYTGSVNAAKAGAMIRIDTRGVEPTPGARAYSVFQIQARAAGVADPNYTVPVQIGAAPEGTFCIQTNGLATFNYGFVVNEGGGDYDTRFEGDTDTHLFFADASTDRIGIGTNAPGYKLDVNGTANFANNVTFTGGTANGVLYLNGSKVATSGSALTFDGTNLSSTGGATFLGSPSGFGGGEIRLGPTTTDTQSAISTQSTGTPQLIFDHRGTSNTGVFIWRNGTGGGSEQMRLTSTGLGIGTSSPAEKLNLYAASTSVGGLIDSGGTASVSFLQLKNSAPSGRAYSINVGGPTSSFGSNFFIYDNTAAATRVTLDSSGNLGLGVTPSAWNTSFRAIEVAATGNSIFSATGGGNTLITQNAYYDGTGNWIYARSSTASHYEQVSGTHKWLTAASGTAGNAITWTQAMTLSGTSDVNLLIGTTSPAYAVAGRGVIEVNGSSSALIAIKSGDTARGYFAAGSTATELAAVGASQPLLFTTNSGERARITSGGDLLVGTTTSSSRQIYFKGGAVSTFFATFEHTNTDPAGLQLQYSGAAPNGTGNVFLSCFDTGATRANIRSNGGLANYQSNNVDLSDARTKNSITPAASMWDKIGALEIVTYKYNDQTHDDVNIGVIAQQVESVEPVWVDADGFGETPEGEEPLKTVYTKDITFAAIKALQEAMARIEQLEAKVAALETK